MPSCILSQSAVADSNGCLNGVGKLSTLGYHCQLVCGLGLHELDVGGTLCAIDAGRTLILPFDNCVKVLLAIPVARYDFQGQRSKGAVETWLPQNLEN